MRCAFHQNQHSTAPTVVSTTPLAVAQALTFLLAFALVFALALASPSVIPPGNLALPFLVPLPFCHSLPESASSFVAPPPQPLL
jgi:hypothetical protein